MDNIEKVFKVVETIKNENKKNGLKKLFENNENFFISPASIYEDRHSCYPGGLCAHSMNVVNNLCRLNNTMKMDFHMDTLVFLGLVHDFGKCGIDGVERYVPNNNEFQKNNGKLYKYNEECAHISITDSTLYTLQKYNIVLEKDEYLAIRLAENKFTNKQEDFYTFKEPDLAFLLLVADSLSMREEIKK